MDKIKDMMEKSAFGVFILPLFQWGHQLLFTYLLPFG
jgi:hypothetical protein